MESILRVNRSAFLNQWNSNPITFHRRIFLLESDSIYWFICWLLSRNTLGVNLDRVRMELVEYFPFGSTGHFNAKRIWNHVSFLTPSSSHIHGLSVLHMHQNQTLNKKNIWRNRHLFIRVKYDKIGTRDAELLKGFPFHQTLSCLIFHFSCRGHVDNLPLHNLPPNQMSQSLGS